MNTIILQKALEHYVQSTECKDNNEQEAVLQTIKELSAVVERSTAADIWNHECFVVTAWTMDNFMINETYDIYAGLYDKFGQADFDKYAFECRKTFGLEDLTNDQLEFGYELVRQQYIDNQELASLPVTNE